MQSKAAITGQHVVYNVCVHDRPCQVLLAVVLRCVMSSIHPFVPLLEEVVVLIFVCSVMTNS